MQKLRDILDHSPECKGKYELVPLSGTETNKIADVLVEMYNAANLEMHDNVDANWKKQQNRSLFQYSQKNDICTS